MAVKITNGNFEAEVLGAAIPVLVDFSATWCGPCQMLSPIVDEIAAEKAQTLKVCKADVDEVPELAAKYGVMSIPALLMFRNGAVVGTSVGYLSKPELEAFVAKGL